MTSGAQNIRVLKVDEKGNEVETCDVNFASINDFLNTINDSHTRFPLMSYIDPFDNTFYNSLQTIDLIKELKSFEKESGVDSLIDDINKLTSFLEKIEVHTHVKFQGD